MCHRPPHPGPRGHRYSSAQAGHQQPIPSRPWDRAHYLLCTHPVKLPLTVTQESNGVSILYSNCHSCQLNPWPFQNGCGFQRYTAGHGAGCMIRATGISIQGVLQATSPVRPSLDIPITWPSQLFPNDSLFSAGPPGTALFPHPSPCEPLKTSPSPRSLCLDLPQFMRSVFPWTTCPKPESSCPSLLPWAPATCPSLRRLGVASSQCSIQKLEPNKSQFPLLKNLKQGPAPYSQGPWPTP